MRLFSKILFTSAIITLLVGCKEQKGTTNETPKTEVSNSSETEQTTTTSMNKINPDGTANAELKCEGSSHISSMTVAGKEMITDQYTCTINNGTNLSITFTSDEATLTFELYEAGSFPIQTGVYEHMTKGTSPYAIVRYQNHTNGNPNGDFSLEIFEGNVTILDYGMSSNILCGSFDVTDNNGNSFKGTFNEMVSSF